MNGLVQRRCIPCEAGVEPLSREEAEKLFKETPEWRLDVEGKTIEREFKFKNFPQAMAFVHKVAEIAEGEGHHPDIYIFYNKVRLSHSTHAIGGLSENDFILAAKVDRIVERGA